MGYLSVFLERNEIAQGTTRAAGGMLGAHSEYLNDTFYSFARESQALYKEFQHDSGIDIGYTTGGILQFAQSNEERMALSRWKDATYLPAEQLREFTSHRPLSARIFLRMMSMSTPRRLPWHFARRQNNLGATVSEDFQVDEIES